MADASAPSPATFPGAIVTVLGVGFLAIGVWFAGAALLRDTPPGDHTRTSNERLAFDHLKQIQAAQNAFCKRHPRGEYACFVAHLWQWVDPRGTPVRLNLIPRCLAMAMGATTAVDGYYFVDIRARTGKGQPGKTAIDYARRWSVAALPAAFGRTGRIAFLADQTGHLFAMALPRPPTTYPEDPLGAGWRVLDTAGTLKQLQQSLSNEK